MLPIPPKMTLKYSCLSSPHPKENPGSIPKLLRTPQVCVYSQTTKIQCCEFDCNLLRVHLSRKLVNAWLGCPLVKGSTIACWEILVSRVDIDWLVIHAIKLFLTLSKHMDRFSLWWRLLVPLTWPFKSSNRTFLKGSKTKKKPVQKGS